MVSIVTTCFYSCQNKFVSIRICNTNRDYTAEKDSSNTTAIRVFVFVKRNVPFWPLKNVLLLPVRFAFLSFFLPSMCFCFRASSPGLAGFVPCDGDKDSVAAVAFKRVGQAGKVWRSAVEFARF